MTVIISDVPLKIRQMRSMLKTDKKVVIYNNKIHSTMKLTDIKHDILFIVLNTSIFKAFKSSSIYRWLIANIKDIKLFKLISKSDSFKSMFKSIFDTFKKLGDHKVLLYDSYIKDILDDDNIEVRGENRSKENLDIPFSSHQKMILDMVMKENKTCQYYLNNNCKNKLLELISIKKVFRYKNNMNEVKQDAIEFMKDIQLHGY